MRIRTGGYASILQLPAPVLPGGPELFPGLFSAAGISEPIRRTCAGAVILDTGQQSDWILAVMMAIVWGPIKQDAFDGTTQMVRELTFETYNQKFRSSCTPPDWLYSNDKQLNAYLKDLLRKENISAGPSLQLLGAMHHTGSCHAYHRWNKAMPVLLLSGQDDPIGEMGKAGLTNVTMHIISNACHDPLHEERRNARSTNTEPVAAKSYTMGQDPAKEHQRRPTVARQNEGIADAAERG